MPLTSRSFLFSVSICPGRYTRLTPSAGGAFDIDSSHSKSGLVLIWPNKNLGIQHKNKVPDILGPVEHLQLITDGTAETGSGYET